LIAGGACHGSDAQLAAAFRRRAGVLQRGGVDAVDHAMAVERGHAARLYA
jgi:hypothetical protein